MKFFYFYEGIEEEVEVTSTADKHTIHINHRLGSFDIENPQFEFKDNSINITGFLALEKDKFTMSTIELTAKKSKPV